MSDKKELAEFKEALLTNNYVYGVRFVEIFNETFDEKKEYRGYNTSDIAHMKRRLLEHYKKEEKQEAAKESNPKTNNKK